MEDEDDEFSLITVLAYYKNFIVNAKDMFESLIVPAIINPPSHKKGKEIDVKNIVVKGGQVISAKWGNKIKGIDPKPIGEYKFHVELKGSKGDKGSIKIFQDTYDNINKYHKKGKILFMEKLAIKTKKESFPHQITINYAYKTGQNINMFIFRKSIKISGFQSEKYAIKMIKKMWTLHLTKSPTAITYLSTGKPSFIFESSMTNSTFETDYVFSLSQVNTLMNKLKDSNKTDLEKVESIADRLKPIKPKTKGDSNNAIILNSDYETSIDNGVKITLLAVKPEDYSFNEIVWEEIDKGWTDTTCITIDGRNKSADFEKRTTITLYNEKFVISTRYGAIMEKTRKYLMDILNSNREKLQVVKVDKIKKYKPVFI